MARLSSQIKMNAATKAKETKKTIIIAKQTQKKAASTTSTEVRNLAFLASSRKI